MNELAKLVESSRSLEKTIETIDFPEYNKYINKTPTYNPKKYFNNYFYQCNCLCHGKKAYHCNHCHCHHHIHHNLSCLNMRNPAHKYKPNLYRNKTMNNLMNYDYKIREIDPRKIYYINYNENSNSNINKYNDNTNNSNHQLYIDKNLKENDNDNIIYDNNYYYNSQNYKTEIENNNNNIDNHKYHNIVHKNKDKENGNIKEDIKEKNIEINKKEIEPVNSPQISRREVARYFHIVNPRKYSYEKEAQYTDNKDNHRYKEIRRIDGQEDKIILKSLPKNKNYNYINISNNNTEIISNAYYRYRTTENSQKYLDPIIIDSPKEQLKSPQIVKETFNTRLVNSKSFKKSPSEKVIFNPKNQIKYIYNIYNSKKNNFDYNEEPNLNSISKNFTFNSYNEYDDSDGLQIPSNNNNSKLRYKQFYDEKYDYNTYIKPTSNYNCYKISSIRNTNNNNNSTYNNNNINKNIPKTFSLNNIFKNKLSNPIIVKNEYKYATNNNKIKKIIPPNIDYATLKQTVKLAVLKKQIKEQDKRKNLNNGNDSNNAKYLKNKKNLKNVLLNEYNGMSRNVEDNLTILEKTKKLLEKDKYKNGNIYNHKNDYNQNILKVKPKIWKP